MASTLLPEQVPLESHRKSHSAQTRRYGFFPGCVAKESCKELFNSTMLLADRLGIELIELTAASCCGASVVNDVNRDIARVLNARTYAQAEALGLDDVITICSTCTGHMRAANKELLESETQMDQANAILAKFGAKYEGNVMVRHLLWLLIDDIGLDNLRNMVVRPLNGLRVAPFYGCHIIRPESVNGWESARNPHSLEDVIAAIGGEPVDYAGKTRCCGFHIQLEKDDTAANMVGQNMRIAKDHGAEAVITPCPLCHLALDGYQADSAARWGRTDLPTFHLPQLVAFALGVPPDKLGLNKHLIDARTIMVERELIS
ncbi:MAG: CoB--CoM heterodisulfide reductase iron-sulfur subunit B family protein [Candidatus Eremiobacteraeota bacterium]|nr:CoB--CoM heterodisulfide reductase iron-sulfur subunit B family protein [Candidatus Eremiobacteraeota bacterium]MBV8375264.1 CoB--CoM heterodisulfide reductase iron-sulfur subunit B family protein [Candidatus Eremiobacteraeota bacterium]